MTNGLTLLATLLLLLFYLFQYVLKNPKPVLAVFGLTLLAFGMMVDGLSWVYVVPTAISAVCAFTGVKKPP